MKGTRVPSGLQIICLTLGLTLMASGGLLTFSQAVPSHELPNNAQTRLRDTLQPMKFLPRPLMNLQPPNPDNSLSAQLSWNYQVNWPSWASHDPFSVNLSQGMLSQESLYFTQIEPEPIQLAVEDYNPANCPFEDYIWSSETAFMGFAINGTERVRIDGFWIYLRGESKGIFRYRIYSAQAGTQAVTAVNTSGPCTDWIEEPISPTLQPGQERWLWIDTNQSTLILNPLATYSNTFYFALARASPDDTLINWVYCRDDANPDEEDEGDCYSYFNSFTYRPRDLFLNISILPYNLSLVPTDITMEVNGAAVTNLSSSSKGWWDSGEYQPPLVLNGVSRGFHVSVNWPNFYQWPVAFDVRWTGTLIDVTAIISGFDFTLGHLGVNWILTLIVDFPQNVENQTLLLPLDPEWVVQFITRNTLRYEDWTVTETVLLVDNAEDGLWHVYCSVPISPFSLFGGLIIWVLVLLVITFMVLFTFYRYQLLLPRQRTRRRLLQAMTDSFSDIEKIKRILLIHKETGLCLLDPIVDKTMKANLVGALIQAITTFGISLTESEETTNPSLTTDTALREITYRDFHIIVHDGTYMRNAIIFKQPPHAQLHTRLEQFTADFEDHYADVLENWAGRLNIFGEAIDLVDKYFFITFRIPHVIHPEKLDTASLSDLESHLFSLAKTLTTTQDSFLIRDLVNHYHAKKDSEAYDVFEAIYNLRQQELIAPLQTHIPYTLTNHENPVS